MVRVIAILAVLGGAIHLKRGAWTPKSLGQTLFLYLGDDDEGILAMHSEVIMLFKFVWLNLYVQATLIHEPRLNPLAKIRKLHPGPDHWAELNPS